MRFLSIITAALLSSLTIASPLSNTERESLEVVPRATACVVSHLDIFNDDVKYGLPFCRFYVATPRSQSPVPGLTTQQVFDVCQCIINGKFQPAARVGVDWDPISTFKVATRTIVQYSTITVAESTVALTTVRSVPILTTGVSTITEKHTITVTAKASNAGAGATKTIAKTTITQKVTIAKTTITAKASAKTLTIAKTTITANNQNAKPTTVIRTTTLSAVGSPQKTITIAKTTITAKASGATKASSASTRTVTSIKTVASPQKTVTIAKTTVTATASNTAKASSAAHIVSTRTVTSVKTVGAQTTATEVVTFYPSIITITNTLTQAGTTPATTATTVITLKSSSKSSSVSKSSSKSSTSTTSTTKTAAAISYTSTGVATPSASASTTSDPRSTCSLAPLSTPSATVTVGDTEYQRFYRGCGYTEDPNNPGNAYYSDNFPPVVSNYTSVMTADQAVQQCAEDAYYRFDDPNEYLSFDLHFISTSGEGLAGEGAGFWQCVQYFSEQSDSDTSGYFNVTNSAVSVAYGYSSGLYSDAAAQAAKSNAKRAVADGSDLYPATRGQGLTYGSHRNFTRGPGH